MSAFQQEFNSLLHSNLSCAGTEVVTGRWMLWLGASIAHYGIGITMGTEVLLRGRSVLWFWGFLALIALKEVAFDIPNSGYSVIVAVDSAWDLVCYTVGFFVLWTRLMMSDKQRAGGQ